MLFVFALGAFPASAASGMTVTYDASGANFACVGSYSLTSVKVYDDITMNEVAVSSCKSSKWTNAEEFWIKNTSTTYTYTFLLINNATGNETATIRLLPSATWHRTLTQLGGNDFSIKIDPTCPPYVSRTDGIGMSILVTQRAKSDDWDSQPMISENYFMSGQWVDLIWTDYEGYTPSSNRSHVWICGNTSKNATYTIFYKPLSTAVRVTIYYCSPDGTRLYTGTVKHEPGIPITVDTQQLLDETYLFPGRQTAPASFTASGTTAESKTVYVVNTEAAYTSGYSAGKKKANQGLSERLNEARNNGYDEGYAVGLNKGLLQNNLTAEQIEDLKSEYNVFTAHLDSMWQGVNDGWNDIFSGIKIGGVTLGTFVFVALIVLALIILIKLVWK